MGTNRTSFCQVAHLAALAAGSAGRWAGVAMPFTIRRMADPTMGGSVLEVIEFILGGDVG